MVCIVFEGFVGVEIWEFDDGVQFSCRFASVAFEFFVGDVWEIVVLVGFSGCSFLMVGKGLIRIESDLKT